jgi:acyl-CoA dehydrogenase
MNAGDASMCFGLSEPGAGSDAAALATRAVPHGDGWKISGRKIWTTNAPVADYCIVFAQTNPSLANARKGGISAFLVPTSSPGFEVQRIIPLFGNIGGDEAELRLDEVFVEPWQLVGELDRDSTRRYTAFRWDASTIRLARWDTGDGHLSSHWNIRKCAKRSGIRSRSIRA